MPLLRKIFFYIFALIYCIICPLLILRMLGFVHDPATGLWVKTGIIYVSSNPSEATVYINGRRMMESSPAVIRDLTPGEYNLRLEMPGYVTWENQIPVVDKKATVVENILLIPQAWKIKPLSNKPVKQIIPMPGSTYSLATAGPAVKDILIFRLGRGFEENTTGTWIGPSHAEPLFPEESIYRNAAVERFYTVYHSPFFILRINTGEKDKYLWIDPRDRQVHIEDISDLLTETPQKIYWEASDEKNIFVYLSTSVNRINIKAKAIYPNIAERDLPVAERRPPAIPDAPKADQVFLINNGNTFLFRQGSTVYLMDEQTFVQPRLTTVITVAKNSDIFFADKTGTMYYIDKKTGFLSSLQIWHNKPLIPKPIADTLRLKQMEK